MEMTTNTSMTCQLLIVFLVLCGTQLHVQAAAPVFNSGLPTTYTISDSTGALVSVALVVATDADSDPIRLYMAFSPYFVFADNFDGTGEVLTDPLAPVLEVSGTTVTLTFTAIDSTNADASTTYSVTVTNEAPTLSGLPTSAQLSEDTILETLVYVITCSDPSDDVSSSLVSVTPSNSPSQELFFVQKIPTNTSYGVYSRSQSDSSQGRFSYNTQRDYVVDVECTDQKDAVTGSLTVNLQQNQAPVITTPSSSATQTVLSTVVAGDVVYTVTATDAESDTISFTYSSDPTGAPFNVLASGAVLATSDMASVTASSSYTLTITPADEKNNGTSVTLTLVISGANNAPTFTNLNNTVTVDENTANATSIFQVSTSDLDGDSLTLLITSIPATGTSLFALNGSDVLTISDLNYETLTDTVYELSITASDGLDTATATLTVSLIDVNENLVWTASTYRADIAEGSAVGTTLTSHTLNVTDPDTGDTLTCEMSCVLSGYFSISTSCVITVTSVYSLDAGLPNNVTCSVNGTDSGGNLANTTLIIDIVDTNNYTPTFAVTTYVFSVSGYEALNTTLGTVSATDSDAGTFGEFSYSLNQSAFTETVFNINATSGLISTAISIENCGCTGITWTIPVYATDKGGLVGTAFAQITVGATTTTISTTTTDRPRSFLEDPRNAAWFSVFLAALIIAAIITGLVLITQAFTSTRFVFRDRNRPRNRLYNRQRDRDFPLEDTDIPARNYPRPLHEQPWRNEYRY